ncbi:MAG: ABC transporter permease, partial [Candidatus Omnitrophica bacterium]|nr:ABC transporter permease [Candidatus Omnitrophota bacterium]
ISANIQVWLPMLIVPLILSVALPAGGVLAISLFGLKGREAADLQEWLKMLPPEVLAPIQARWGTLEQQVVFLMVNFMLPLFLLIPVMTSMTIAADSFAGEKERGTLEGLLFAPIDLLSLFSGKVLAALLPASVLSLISFTLSAVAINLAGWPIFRGAIFFPNVNWLPLMLLVIPTISLASVLVVVFISARVSSFQAAYQTGGLFALPVIGLLVGQATGLLILNAWVSTLVGILLLLLDLGLLRLAVRGLDRRRLFETQIR